MSCIVYDKDGKKHKVKAVFVSHMLIRGYTSSPKSEEDIGVAKLDKEIQNELILDSTITKTSKAQSKGARNADKNQG